MKVKITRKESGIDVRECFSWWVNVCGCVLLYDKDINTIYALNACDWLECEVVDE